MKPIRLEAFEFLYGGPEDLNLHCPIYVTRNNELYKITKIKFSHKDNRYHIFTDKGVFENYEEMAVLFLVANRSVIKLVLSDNVPFRRNWSFITDPY